eukprot:CAMPEP_0117471670 /NCGR_PEP_ID=MMETSP0784-20121206/7850_1 /TAXON_ID=39447 /ORGANISM="" /LENGTH=427 /DNA_ID=CAMNT_0005265795 /DNA_START=15 /DNA_END=1298 /DNA_ORIENTATION=+
MTSAKASISEYVAVSVEAASDRVTRRRWVWRLTAAALASTALVGIGAIVGWKGGSRSHAAIEDAMLLTEQECPLSKVSARHFPQPSYVEKNTSKECLKCPPCLDPSGTCLTDEHLVFRVLPECFKFAGKIPSKDNAMCKRSMYRCPTTGVLASLPLFTNDELSVMYGCYYTGQASLGISNERWISEAREIIKYGGLQGKTGLRIAEVGCAHGYVLYHLRHQAANGGELIGIEPDPSFKVPAEQTFAKARKDVSGTLKTKLISALFDEDLLPDGSLDVITSSQVVEHIAETCKWIRGVWNALKPGGIVFTDLPIQYYNFDASSQYATDFMLYKNDAIYRGEFHITLFGHEKLVDEFGGHPSGLPFARMMEAAGFEHVWHGEDINRYVFCKPLAAAKAAADARARAAAMAVAAAKAEAEANKLLSTMEA